MASSDLFYSMKFTFCHRTLLVIQTRYQLQREEYMQNMEKEKCPLSYLLYDFGARWNLYRWILKLIYTLTEINHSAPNGGLAFFFLLFMLPIFKILNFLVVWAYPSSVWSCVWEYLSCNFFRSSQRTKQIFNEIWSPSGSIRQLPTLKIPDSLLIHKEPCSLPAASPTTHRVFTPESCSVERTGFC